MSILIKSMDMPKSCDECSLMSPDYGCALIGSVGADAGRKRCDDCPLVEIPKHGHLIDADALFKSMDSAGWYQNADRDEVALELILDAPTVIEAEE